MAEVDVDNTSLAVLIDADNANAAIIDGLLAEIAGLGVASVRRIYGDWTTPQLAKWKDVLLDHSIKPVQQFGYTKGKNATDIAMIIDAMDLLHSGDVDGFCLVSSDSDFTGLAARLRESGKRVYGFGERKTPRSLVAACDRFIYTEIFREADEAQDRPASRQGAKELRQDARLVALIRSAVDAASGEDGWASLGVVGSNINKKAPDFDPRTYGYAKLGDLVEAIGVFSVARQGQVVLVNTKKNARLSNGAR